MSDPRLEQHFRRIKDSLGASPEDGWIFGVCAAIARRMDWELWAVRLVAVMALLAFTLLTIGVYFAAAMFMEETRPSAQAKLRRWAEKADRLIERIWDALSDHGRNPGRET